MIDHSTPENATIVIVPFSTISTNESVDGGERAHVVGDPLVGVVDLALLAQPVGRAEPEVVEHEQRA